MCGYCTENAFHLNHSVHNDQEHVSKRCHDQEEKCIRDAMGKWSQLYVIIEETHLFSFSRSLSRSLSRSIADLWWLSHSGVSPGGGKGNDSKHDVDEALGVSAPSFFRADVGSGGEKRALLQGSIAPINRCVGMGERGEHVSIPGNE